MLLFPYPCPAGGDVPWEFPSSSDSRKGQPVTHGMQELPAGLFGDPKVKGWTDASEWPVENLLRSRLEDNQTAPEQALAMAQGMRDLARQFSRLRLHYQFGIDEILTKVNILRQEFENSHSYSPIEQVSSRLKSPERILEKVARLGDGLTITELRERIRDIAGVRITCSFISDVYWVATMLAQQPDIDVIQIKDYIANPKPNGYRSLHMIVQIPVYLSDRAERIYVELQIRTIAMDFWASVEHKLAYKYHLNLPVDLRSKLDDAARTATELDQKMAELREEIRRLEAAD